MSKWLQHNLVALEAIMIRFVELAVELRRGRLLKDSLHQFRSVCQNVNWAGLETVIKKLVECSEAKLEAAQAQVAKLSLDQIDDLDESEVSPEIAAWYKPSAEEAKDKADRELVMPWFRFLWENYRSILDICRHNVKLEGLYKLVVDHAFAFCRKYQRKSEFRHLCEILRHHLSIIVKYPNQQNGVLLSDPESHRLQLDIRFQQLNIGTELCLWQEAFRSIEDIHGLFLLARKAAAPSMVINYYEKLGEIFLMSDNYLFLAAAWNKLFVIANAQGLGEEKVKEAALMFMLSTMSIPLMASLSVISNISAEEKESQDMRLAHFLGLQKIPTRAWLLREIGNLKVLQKVPQEFVGLWERMQAGSFEASTIRSLSGVFTSLESGEKLSTFALPIYRNLVARLFEAVSKGSSAPVSIESLRESVALPVECAKAFSLETFIIHGCKTGDFAAHIDQRNGLVLFDRPCFERDAADLGEEMLHGRMSSLVESIQKAFRLVDPEDGAARAKLAGIISSSQALLAAEHKANLGRKQEIERKKEQLEALTQQREREEARERALKAQQEKEAQKAREAEEVRERDRQKLEAERARIRAEQAQRREEELEAMRAKLQKQKDAEKLVAGWRRLDHLERAYRQEEIPLLAQDYERQKVEDRRAYDERVRLLREQSRARHAADLEVKAKLVSMADEYAGYLAKVKAVRLAALEASREQAQADLAAAKAAHREKTLAALQAKHERDLAAQRQREEAQKAEAERARKEEVDKARAAATGRAYIPPSMRAAQEAAATTTTTTTTTSGAFGARPAFGSSTPSAFQSRTSPAPAASTGWRRPGEGSADASGRSAFGSSRPRVQ
jgi:translation initiation factor 3 subunit A